MDLIQLTISYPGGGPVAAVLLGVTGNLLRLAVDGWDDVGEFRLIGGQWYSERGDRVEIDSMPDPVEPGEIDTFWLAPRLGPATESVVWMN